MSSQTPVDPARFREVLSHFPTGVVLITGLDSAGESTGMVVGSFTSVSLDPPLVAFLPSRTSSSYARLDLTRGFVVNVLHADQEALCRRFATSSIRDKWQGVRRRTTAGGLPLLEEAVASVVCRLESVFDGGDHDIVVGRVQQLQVERTGDPLLFFQGGYGRFAPLSLVAPVEEDLLRQVQAADLARAVMERVAAELDVECLAQTVVGHELIHIASAGRPPRDGRPTRVGTRVPFAPPFGSLHVAWAGPEAAEAWIRRGAADTEPTRQDRLDELARVRERGYSVGLVMPAQVEVERAVSAFSQDRAPDNSRALLEWMSRIASTYEPELDADRRHAVRSIAAPIRDRDGTVSMALKILGFPDALSSAEIQQRAKHLAAACQEITAAAPSPS